MKVTTLLLATALLASACKSDEAVVRHDEPNQTIAESEPTQPAASGFESLVAGATSVTVSELPVAPNPSFGGTSRTVRDAAWIVDFIAQVGNPPAGGAVPKCLPKYTLEFALPDGRSQKFTAVCNGASDAVLVAEAESFAAENGAEVQKMLDELATSPSD